MRSQAVKALNQLGDTEFICALSEGLALVVKHMEHLWAGARALYDTGQHHPARILAMIAEEEAAKYLILIDAIRCPIQPQKRRANQLGRFNDHIAKGLYTEAVVMRRLNLRQLQEHLDLYRHTRYLDGPNDVDWIFRNEINEERESLLYVDYVEGNNGFRWSDPTIWAVLKSNMPLRMSRTMTTAIRLHQIGVGTVQSLDVIAGYWRDNSPTYETKWEENEKANMQTLTLLSERGLLTEQPSEIYSYVVNNWQFPMYDLDLTRIPVKVSELREEQEKRNSD